MNRKNIKNSHISGQGLYPPISPYSSGYLAVDSTHNLYWEQCGNPDGVPILVLHGGPGAGTTSVHRRFFDPDHYRIILFDQRGSGKSHPLGSLKNNTRAHLVQDIEKIRKHLRVDQWHLFGGSWGATLALSYAIEHAKYCKSLILRSIFLLEQREIDWFMYGIKNIFPENWERFVSFFKKEERKDLLKHYYKNLTSDDEATRYKAGTEWSLYESNSMSFYPRFEMLTHEDQKEAAVAIARIECHFFLNEVIDRQNSLLNDVQKLKRIPGTIIQGRYDAICPPYSAHLLHQAWPEADYIVVPDGGHSALDPSICTRLVEATNHAKYIS